MFANDTRSQDNKALFYKLPLLYDVCSLAVIYLLIVLILLYEADPTMKHDTVIFT